MNLISNDFEVGTIFSSSIFFFNLVQILIIEHSNNAFWPKKKKKYISVALLETGYNITLFKIYIWNGYVCCHLMIV